jgi:elongation factor Ts
MAEITAKKVKELRDRTSAGMLDCKKALVETDGDIDAAVDYLRKEGLAAAEKKAGRSTTEGLVYAATDGQVGVAVEINSETDFVARNDEFQNFANSVGNAALAAAQSGDEVTIDTIGDLEVDGQTVTEALTKKIATIGENMNLRRANSISVDNGHVESYIHNSVNDNLGKIGVIVALQSDADQDKLAPVAKKLAMHIAAARPTAVTQDDVPAEEVDRETHILTEQARESGKPEEIIEKMVQGRLRKFFQDVVLLQQDFVMDTDRTVGEFIADAAEEIGSDVEVADFIRLELGEGIEKEEEDFAQEVQAAMAG